MRGNRHARLRRKLGGLYALAAALLGFVFGYFRLLAVSFFHNDEEAAGLRLFRRNDVQGIDRVRGLLADRDNAARRPAHAAYLRFPEADRLAARRRDNDIIFSGRKLRAR